MKIFLLGYMGSGKSYIGKMLSEQINLNYYDLDEEIEKLENATISEIFQKRGEIYFRKLERKILEDLINKEGAGVFSLGGGTPCYGDNMELISKADGIISFHLKMSISSLAERLFEERANRPLISHLDDRMQLEEFIGKHLFERSFYYNQANHVIDCNGKTAEMIITSILQKLK